MLSGLVLSGPVCSGLVLVCSGLIYFHLVCSILLPYYY